MSLKYIDSNGASHVVSGMTPGGNLETGAVAIREGNIELPSLGVGANTYSVSFSSPMPDDNYEIYVEAIAGFPYNSGSILFIPYHNNEKTANGFKLLVYNNTGGVVAAGLSLYYKAFKLYEVADAEALYSDVTDIKSYIPSNASSSNKLSTANDLRTETRSLDRRIDDLEDVVPSDAGISNMLVTQDDLSGVEIDKVEDINDVELTSIQDGQTLIWDATNSKWVNGQGGKTYSAGNGINISGADEISTNTDNTSVVIGNNKELKVADTYKTIFVGTQAQWNALSTADKVKYNEAHITDDVSVITADLVTFDTSKMPSDYPIGTFPILVPLNTIQYHGIYIGINCRGVAVNTGTFMHCIVSGGDNFSSFSIVCVNGTWSINMIGSDWALTSAAFTVIADGVKTYRQLFNELLTKYLSTGRTIKSLLTDNCKIVINDTIVLEISEANQQYLRAGAFKGGPNQVMSVGVQINLTGTTTYSTYNIGSSGGTYTDGSTNVPAKDTTFTIVFGK